ncbi:MAG: hypothetical protein JOZ03_02825, partial [Gammaproteobacteria bacterium]|nr:hypothetical protein [Gammaproteobacteria bacterium]
MMGRVHRVWLRIRSLLAVLAIVRFSLLIPAALAATLIVSDQMVDILRAVGEDRRVRAILFLCLTSAGAGLAVWYTARTMLRFRFDNNPASDPAVYPRLKRVLPRALGIAVPGMLALRVALLTPSSPALPRLNAFAIALATVTALVAIYIGARREIARRTGLVALAVPEAQEKRNLARWRDLPEPTLAVFWV